MKRQIALLEHWDLDDPELARQYATSAAARNGTRTGRVLAKALSEMGFEKGRILDVGTGAGQVPIELARALPGAKIVGLDRSAPLLGIARLLAEQAGLTEQLSFEKGDAQAMPFQDDSFEAVVSVNTLHAVNDPVAMLDEIERVLAPEGILLISDIKRSWPGLFMPILLTAYTLGEVKEWLGRSKLRSWDFRFHDSLLWFSMGAAGPQQRA